jgi:hypothetical protein
MYKNFIRAAAPAVIALAFAACGDSPSATETVQPGPISFEIISGNGQTGAAGEELPQPVVVRAVDGSGNPVVGRHVGFAVVNGDGEMYVGGGVSDTAGIVKDYWTLGRVAGDSQRIEARSVDPATGAKQVFGVFTATAVPGAPARTVKISPATSGWSQPVRSLVLDSLRVGVVDRFGNRIYQAGIPVQWTASHGGNVARASGIINTDAQGISTTQWRLGSVATDQTLATSVAGGTPQIMYYATGKPQSPSIVHYSVDSVQINALLQAIPFSVTATDAYGNAVAYTLTTLSPVVQATSATTFRSATNGVGRIVLAAGSKADTLVVTVQQVAASIIFRTLPASVKVGATLDFRWYSVIRDANNQQITNVSNAWTSTNPAVASVNSVGMVTANATGTAKIVVSKDGVTAESPTINVVP